MLRLTPGARDEMFGYAIAQLPIEACGLFSVASGSDLVDRFHGVVNSTNSATAFALDGEQMLAAESEIDRDNRILFGVMHSHPTSSAYPSPTDVADISRFDPYGTMHHLIVSLRGAEPVLRSYRIIDEKVIEEPVVLDSPLDPVGDDPVASVSALFR